jgi:ATPase subunit of ABC transporter with duplicated ATPase domains
MRIALARALFIKPHLLLLDEPTNHLDLEACVWLEEELSNYKQILVIISHSQDFMNGVCTQVMHLDHQRLQYYGGNYDAFVKTRMELLESQAKKYDWEQDQIAHMKVIINCRLDIMGLLFEISKLNIICVITLNFLFLYIFSFFAKESESLYSCIWFF